MKGLKFPVDKQPQAAGSSFSFNASTFLRDRDGSTAAEFALCVMVLVAFLFGTMTFGWMFHFQNSIETAAREGARAMAVLDWENDDGGGVVAATRRGQRQLRLLGRPSLGDDRGSLHRRCREPGWLDRSAFAWAWGRLHRRHRPLRAGVGPMCQ